MASRKELAINILQSCPCGSGKEIINCCFQTGDILKPTAWSPRRSPIITGYSNPRCYAAQLGDCVEKVTGEHYISKNILIQLYRNRSMVVQGLPWLKRSDPVPVSPDALKGKVLCKRHNEALSGLDIIAGKLFATMEVIAEESLDPKRRASSWYELFNGHDIERWMLKALCGLLASGNAAINGQPIRRFPPMIWLKVLFQSRPFPQDTGLYCRLREGQAFSGGGFGIVPLMGYPHPSLPNDIMGLIAYFSGFELILYLGTAPRNTFLPGTMINGAIFRPASVIVNNGEGRKAALFAWDQPGDATHILMQYDVSAPSTQQ